MPQMMPCMWSLMIMYTIMTLITLISLIYFFYIPSILNSSTNFKPNLYNWNWKW